MWREVLKIVLIDISLMVLAIHLRVLIERRRHRKRKSEIIYSMIMDNTLLATFMAIVLISVFIGQKWYKIEWNELVDVKALITVVISFFIGLLLYIFRKIVVNRLEDSIKLTTAYGGIIKKYDLKNNDGYYYVINKKQESLMRGKEKFQVKTIKQPQMEDQRRVYFPIIVDARLRNIEIDFFDSFKMYKLPVEVRKYEDSLFQAHDTSYLYNQLNVRVKKWELKGNTFQIDTERTTYFMSMITNRALDYRLSNEMTVRDILQYGPFVPSLEESKLSNHLGFNGFIISADHKIPLVKRKPSLSIAKRTYGPSVGASLKAKYCLDKEEKKISAEGLKRGIIGEIKDELELSVDKDSITMVAAYRDIVEGNKPQLLFFTRVSLTQKELMDGPFKDLKRKSKEREGNEAIEEQEKEDGYKFKWIDEEHLGTYGYLQDRIIVNKKRLQAVPSTIVSLLLLKEYLEEDKKIIEEISVSKHLAEKEKRIRNQSKKKQGKKKH